MLISDETFELAYKEAQDHMKECKTDLQKEEWLMIFYRKKTIKDGVFRIVKEAQSSDHWNGIAKQWASGVFELVQFCAETDTINESHKTTLQSLRNTTSGRKTRNIIDTNKLSKVTVNFMHDNMFRKLLHMIGKCKVNNGL